MTKKIWIGTLGLIIMAGALAAQKDSIWVRPHQGNTFRYHGIQANLLLQQFISFNSNSSINNNPYIYSYATNNATTGKGTAIGVGFLINRKESNDGVSQLTISDVNVSARVGFEHKYLQQERIIPFWGIDFAAGVIFNEVISTLNNPVTGGNSVVETTRVFAGPDFRGGVLFAMSKHLLLGTEFFFNMQVAATNVNNNGNNESNVFPIAMGFQAPTALFLVFRY